MNKVERINTIMRYINNRAHFTISEIMQEFDISRSTAIRDVKEIEALGMPLDAEVGRDGGYYVMHNAVLPAVRFNANEVKALFIAFMATRNQQLPYLKSRQSIAEKLLALISETQQDDVALLNTLLLFQGTNPYNPDILNLSDLPHPILEKLIQTLLMDRYLLIDIKEGEAVISYSIYLMHLYQENSYWFIEGFDLKEEKKHLFPVDHLIKVECDTASKRLSAQKIAEKLSKHDAAINIILELGFKAIVQFKKYHPLKVSLSYTNPYQATAILRAFINIDNEDERMSMISWLLFLGDDIKVIEAPREVLDGIKRRIQGFEILQFSQITC